ncbi:MAG TPA: di-heme-cytochrome C peroxidase [Allosphingosinicella sp.]
MARTRWGCRIRKFFVATALVLPLGAMSASAAGPVVYLDQGSDWTDAARRDFYSRDQGSQMMPLAWLLALRRPDGQPFMADALARYGYLPNPDGENGLPIGFTSSGPAGSEMAGMTCSACHTRQIVVGDREYRVDGGPALVDFQALFVDMVDAVGRVLVDDASFQAFANLVLGPDAPADQRRELRDNVGLWYQREHAMVRCGVPAAAPGGPSVACAPRGPGTPPASPWGLGRLDAVSMILNRVTGLDIGPPPSYLIVGNIRLADAPVRYPFLWNAPVQDFTQWPGFASNGSDILGLARNLGEVYGVFGTYRPRKEWWHLAGINFLHDNSADFEGLTELEDLVRLIGPPKWRWGTDPALVRRGAEIFNRSNDQGGCVACHGERPGKTRFPFRKTWATPILDVGTDSREHAILTRDAASGVLQGASIPVIMPPLKKTEPAFNLLKLSVAGSIIQQYTTFAGLRQQAARTRTVRVTRTLPPAQAELTEAFNPRAPDPGGPYPYESRVLYGIWATAPYLHNGSVQSLAELLKPASQRAVSFPVGRYYDTDAVGLAADQRGSPYMRVTTGCDQRDSGNSRCGHEFGTALTASEKKALLEYLKTL